MNRPAPATSRAHAPARATARAYALLLLALPACHTPAPQAAANPAPAPNARAPQPADPPARSSLSSPWVKARAPDGSSLLEAPARMLAAPGSARTLGVPFRARIETVHVGPGARVRAGETIFSVAMPEVAAAAASYVSSGLRVGALQRRKAQLESLRGEGLARLQDLSEVEVKLAEAASDERIASATLSAAGLSTDQADGIAKAGGRVPLRSPIDGVVVALDTTAGESCEPSARLARIEAVGSGLLESRLPAALAEAGSFQFVPTSGPGRTAHLASRAPGLDPRDGTVLAWLKVEGPPLPAGLTGKLRARLGEGSLAVLVPSGALAWSDGHAVVMRRRGEQPEQLPVRVLSSTGADALVVGALQPGDEVAAEAQGVTGALQGAPEAIAKGEAVGAAGARP